ncbi:MAG: class I SAM-dependent methyltransferase [Acidobacteriota bacterium]
MTEPMPALADIPPGRALDLACGSGRHAVWLRERGWEVTGVDLVIPAIPGITLIQADLEALEYRIEPGAWDLIVCWLYWQPDLLPAIARGVRSGGIVAMAGKTSGRFETSLARYRAAFPQWTELAAGEDAVKAFFIAAKPLAD